MANVNVGLDLGQKSDPSAIVVAELEKREDGWHYLVRHLERLPLGTSYPDVVQRVAGIMTKLREQKHEAQLWVDATGLGQPVVDLLRQAGVYRMTPVYLTGSDKATREGRELRLGKAIMVSRLQVLLQSGRIHLPDTSETAALVSELLNYEIKVSDEGHASFGAFKVGTHDDLVTALGLACWQEKRGVLVASLFHSQPEDIPEDVSPVEGVGATEETGEPLPTPEPVGIPPERRPRPLIRSGGLRPGSATGPWRR